MADIGTGGDGIYSGSGQLTANPTEVDLDGNVISFIQGANPLLYLDPTAGAESSTLRAFNITGGDNFSELTGSTTNTQAEFSIIANFNSGATISSIIGSADVTNATISYIADLHSLAGGIRLTSLAGSGAGIVAVDNDGDLSYLATPVASVSGTANRITSTGGTTPVIDISASYVGQASITTLGTIATGTWNATTIGISKGGTGLTALGTANQQLRVNAGATALEYFTPTGGGDALTSNPLSQFAATTSAQLAGVISDETGSGALVFATAPAMASITLAAGTATAGTGPLYLTSGTNLTVPVSGAVEFDGIRFLTTTASGRGVTPSEMLVKAASDVTLTNATTDQVLFGSTNDVWTLQGNTTYRIRGFYRFTSGSTTHTWAMGFDLAGGASITSILYSTGSWVTAINATSTPRTNVAIDTVATTVATANSTTSAFIEFEGFIMMNAGGTVTPLIKLSADPTGTVLLKANSWISFTPIGDGSFSEIGNVA